MVDLPINRYSFDTVTLLRQGLENARLKLRVNKRAPDSPLSPDAEVYFINASLSEVDDPDEREALMKIPTTMYLTDPQIDRLLLAASRLIRNDPEFQRLMRDMETSPEPRRTETRCDRTLYHDAEKERENRSRIAKRLERSSSRLPAVTESTEGRFSGSPSSYSRWRTVQTK